MSPFHKAATSFFCGALLLFTSCVNDNLEECPPEEKGSYVQFIYDYNTSFEDLFHKDVFKMDLFLFDKDGVYLQTLSEERVTETLPKGYTMKLPEGTEDASQFVAWGNLHTSYYDVTNMVAGSSTIHDLEVAIRTFNQGENLVAGRLVPLFHGKAERKSAPSAFSNDTTVISLMKDMSTFRIVIQSLTENPAFNEQTFHFEVIANSGSFDAWNHLADPQKWHFRDYDYVSDPNAGSVGELNTMRLFTNEEFLLRIRSIHPTEYVVLEVNLNKYLNALKLQLFYDMTLQEYVDREDVYNIIIFVQEDEKDPNKYVAADISINGWYAHQQPGNLK